MDSGSVAGERPKRTPGRQRLLPFGCGVQARPGVSPLPGGRRWLRLRGRAARASPLLLVLLVPSPRLAATAPRRTLAERTRPGHAVAAVALGAGRNAQGRLPLGVGRVAALASSRRELSLSAGCRQLEHRKGNLPSSVSRKLYFDTHALVCLLEANGFTTQQAEIIVSALVKNTETNMDIVYNDMVTKVQQEITLQQIMSKIANVKKDMVILEKSEFSALRAENEKIKLELHQLKQQVMDEMNKVRTDTKLNFNLEKSRVKELYSLNEKKMLQLRTEMVSLHAQQDRALTQTDRKIETEVAGLKTLLEAHKLDTIKYLAGSVFTCLTVALGFYRLWI
ncbi:mitochondrial calcium uniporter regulator 1 isoform X1 [Peromyscus leucopus]|uniref:mitochondrial calcium uniporter regulator 1 isoform X1 n=1 Tax=Peromyscus leucopus TaxID=10041 RepID=UPI0010A139D5|nr:mitochondrial calcium uniporter regulator 1 isoform X1 [Peromyscus leucopus]